MDRRKRIERFTEFLLFGLALGVTEDIIAVKLVTGEDITLRMFWLILAVTVPFAAFSELFVDSDEYRVTEWIIGKLKAFI